MKKAIRFLAAVSVLAMMLTACNPQKPVDPGATGEIGDGVVPAGTEIKVTISSNAANAYNENWLAWKYFQEETGAKFKMTVIPSESYASKVPLMMATPKELPDMFHMFMKEHFEPYVTSNVFVPLDENEELLPNYTKTVAELEEAEREDLLNQHRSGDGHIYQAMSVGTHKTSGTRFWMYRKDIFDKHGLEVPKTFDELYDVCKKLKELYPESYPLCLRDGLFKLEELATSWQPYFSISFYYDYEQEKWLHGPQEPIAKEIVEYFRKMVEEGLTVPNFTSVETSAWETLMSSDRGFITFDYSSRMDQFNVPNREVNPEYNLQFMPPPAGKGPKARQSMAKTNMDMTGYVICNTGDEARVENALKVLDWMYSEEGSEILSWGKEGETFQVNEDGSKSYILKDGQDVKNVYGIGTGGLFQKFDPAAYELSWSKELVDDCYEALEYMEPNTHPGWWLAYNEEETKIRSKYFTDLRSYCSQELSKFLTCEQPMSEWDRFQKDLEDEKYGVQAILGTYESAFNRVKAR